MPNGQPAQLANLRPWRPGAAPKGGRRSVDVDRAIRLARKYSPQAVEFIASVMLDPEQPTALRLKAAEVIIDKAIPKSAGSGAMNLDAKGITNLRVEFVSGNQREEVTIEHEPQAKIFEVSLPP
jgi:hypothetical protein